STPITYTWSPEPESGQGTASATYTWATTGTKAITVTAENCGGVATATYTLLLIPPSSQAIEISQNSGSIVTDTTGLTATVEVPTGAVRAPTVLVYTPLPTPTHSFAGGLGFAEHAFRLEAYQEGVLRSGFVFSRPLTVTLFYSDDAVDGLEEDSLRLYYWDGGGWADVAGTCTPPSAYDRDPVHNQLSVVFCHLTEFALAGAKEQYQKRIYLPLVVRD
ncbi:MAG: hypothetical protein DRI61_03640, partial [Chloroflexi bacterium]